MKEIITTLTKKQNSLSQQNQLVKRFLKSKLFRGSFLTCIYEGGHSFTVAGGSLPWKLRSQLISRNKVNCDQLQVKLSSFAIFCTFIVNIIIVNTTNRDNLPTFNGYINKRSLRPIIIIIFTLHLFAMEEIVQYLIIWAPWETRPFVTVDVSEVDLFKNHIPQVT